MVGNQHLCLTDQIWAWRNHCCLFEFLHEVPSMGSVACLFWLSWHWSLALQACGTHVAFWHMLFWTIVFSWCCFCESNDSGIHPWISTDHPQCWCCSFHHNYQTSVKVAEEAIAPNDRTNCTALDNAVSVTCVESNRCTLPCRKQTTKSPWMFFIPLMCSAKSTQTHCFEYQTNWSLMPLDVSWNMVLIRNKSYKMTCRWQSKRHTAAHPAVFTNKISCGNECHREKN